MTWPRTNKYPDFRDRHAFADGRAQVDPKKVASDTRGIPLSTKLAVTAFAATLPAHTPQTTPVDPTDYVNFINTEAMLAYPRVVNVWTEDASPFDVKIEWTSGGGNGGRVITTGSGGGLQFFCIAKALRIDIANWVNAPLPISLSVEDGLHDSTQDLHRIERQFTLAAGANRTFPIPSYARSLTVASNNPAQRPNILVQLDDSTPVAIAAFNADDGHIAVGNASTITLVNNDAAALASYMLDFALGYL